MCCRCPPSLGPYSYIYILLTVVATFYFQHAKSIYFEDLKYITTNGKHIHDEFIIEKDVRSIVEGTERTGLDPSTMKTPINNKSFCEIMDNYIYYHIGEPVQKPVSLCLVQTGFHQIYDKHPGFNDVAMRPLEIPTRKTFWPELIRHDEKIACKQFQFINGGQNNGILQENGF